MSVKHKYRFYIDDIRVYPVWSQNANLKWSREGEFVFLRLKLTGTFTLVNGVRKDFNLVWAKDLDHEFVFRAEYIVDGEIEETINGTFYKTDCPLWDIDNERVDVVVQTIDRYEKLMKAFDKEFDLVQVLQPETYALKYKKEPQIQITFPYFDKIYNRVGASSFVTEMLTTYGTSELGDFGFVNDGVTRIYIPGTGDMSPDVSGLYIYQGADVFLRDDGIYDIYTAGFPISANWYIREVALNNTHYEYLDASGGPYFGLFAQRHPFEQDVIFVNQNNASIRCSCFPVNPYHRILTDVAVVDGDATLALPQPDIGDLTFGYDRYIDQSALVFKYMAFIPSNEHTTTPTRYGKYDEDAIHFAEEYFNPSNAPFVGTPAYPLLNQSWTEYALMEYLVGGYYTQLVEASSDIILRDAYTLADVIKLLLAQIDTAITFDATALHSKFLFDVSEVNPISGDAQTLTHFITPKSNVIISDYSQPDTREFISFGNIDQLLKAANLYWWIDNQGNFKIEHIAFFKNGRSYDFGTPFIGVNLTTLLEPRTGKYWGYHTNKFRYTKEKMPEQFIFGWMDKQSEYFDGYPIKINSGFVEKGLIPDMKVSKFSSDLSLAIAFPENFSVEGFFVLSAEFIGGDWIVPLELFEIATFTNIPIQNGFWTFYNLHDKFWRHNLPSPDANINGEDITAITTKRGKEQNLVFPAGMNPDPTRLVTSGIGNCEVDEMQIDLASRKCTLKVLGDLDFDNPCPTC